MFVLDLLDLFGDFPYSCPSLVRRLKMSLWWGSGSWDLFDEVVDALAAYRYGRDDSYAQFSFQGF